MTKEKIDITKHVLVPKHIKLNQEEINELLQKYNVSLRQLPKISVKDPMSKLLEAKIGDVIKIIRKSPTAAQSDFFRVVVD